MTGRLPFLCFQRRAPGDVLVGRTKVAGSAQRRSSGAVLHAGLRWAQRLRSGNVVLLFADAGWKYLESLAFAGPLPEGEEEAMDDVIWW